MKGRLRPIESCVTLAAGDVRKRQFVNTLVSLEVALPPGGRRKTAKNNPSTQTELSIKIIDGPFVSWSVVTYLILIFKWTTKFLDFYKHISFGIKYNCKAFAIERTGNRNTRNNPVLISGSRSNCWIYRLILTPGGPIILSTILDA